jgi:hypothetical protein
MNDDDDDDDDASNIDKHSNPVTAIINRIVKKKLNYKNLVIQFLVII